MGARSCYQNNIRSSTGRYGVLSKDRPFWAGLSQRTALPGWMGWRNRVPSTITREDPQGQDTAPPGGLTTMTRTFKRVDFERIGWLLELFKAASKEPGKLYHLTRTVI